MVFVKCAHDTNWPDKYFLIYNSKAKKKKEKRKCGKIRLIDFLVEATRLPPK